MKRSYLYSGMATFGIAMLVASSLALNGCKAPTTAYQVQQFASLRIMNFAPSGPNCTPTAPMDIYWSTNPPVISGNNAQVYNLKYGVGSVYTNSLAASTSGTDYYVTATPARIPAVKDLSNIDVKLFPGKFTVMITLDPTNPGAFLHSLVQDGAPSASPDSTYVRFINMQAGVGALTLRVNDPLSGEAVNSIPLNFNQVGSYYALQVAKDTSYAFFVVNSSNQVLARLSYQTYVGGESYTLVYAGDPCQTVANNPADTTTSAVDTLRLRAFDDNTSGNDQTNPILYSYRYNIVNDIYPSVPYNSAHSENNVLGFLNGESFPQYWGFSINPIPALQAGGAYVNAASPQGTDTAYNVYYQSTALSSPLDIKIFSTSPTGTNQQLVYDYNVANPASSIAPDMPVTFLFTGGDTVTKTSVLPYWNVQGKVIPLPDVGYSDSVTIVFYNALNATYKMTGTALKTYLYITDPNNNTILPPFNGYFVNRPAPTIFNLPATSSGTYSIVDSIGSGNNLIQGNAMKFQASPGGIYEVLAVGTKLDPHLLILRVNADNK